MKERICWVLVFSSCTTALATGESSGLVTTPSTLRVPTSPFLPWANAPAIVRLNSATVRTAPMRFMCLSQPLDATERRLVSGRTCGLSPILFLLFFFVFDVVLFLLFLVAGFISRFEFQRVGADDFQVRSALVATDRAAFIDIFFIYVNCAIAYRTGHHRNPPNIYCYTTAGRECNSIFGILFTGNPASSLRSS